MEIPILSNMVEGLRVFFKTRRYISYLIIFLFTIFLSFMFSALMSTYVGDPLELTLVTFFVYVGATGTIYFALGSLIMGVGADSLWITRRGRGRVTELKGVVWLAISFALTVVLSYAFGREALLFFSIFCWIGWIAFQAYLSSRTSLRLATIAEPKKGGIAIGIGSFIVLIFGLTFSTVLTLVFVPVVYVILDNISNRVKSWFVQEPVAKVGDDAAPPA